MATANAEVPIIDDLEAKLLQASTECQQNFYEICSDWNLYQKDEHVYLRDFIGYALYGPPDFKESTDLDKTKHNFKHFYYNDDQRKVINSVFDKVIEYGTNKDSDGVLLCGIIYNVIFNKEEAIKAAKCTEVTKKEKDDKEEKESKNDAQISKKITETEIQVYPVPVFKVRIYHEEKKEMKNNCNKKDAENVEKIFYIDNAGRVYHGFADYLETNTLPKCTMVLPKDGRYQADPTFLANLTNQNIDVTTKVWIDVHKSPASKIAAKLLMGGDLASTVVGVAAMGVGLAGLVTPIGAGIALASAMGAGVSGFWTVGRCTQQLVDRGHHGESINVTDKNALGSWIGIAGGAMGLAATGGTVLLTRAVRTGATVGRAATIAYDAVQIGNLIVNGVGLGFKGYDIYDAYNEGGLSNISWKDAFFLSAHLFFFCNSVINIRLAQNMIETTQGQLLKDYEASLRSNRHRKEFQRLARNTRAAGSSDRSSNEEIIRAINKISNKDEFWQALVRNRKTFSASGAKASFSSDGKISVNGIMTIDPIEFASLPKDIRVDIVKGVSTVVLEKPSGSINGNNEVSYKNYTANNNKVLKEFCLKHSSAMLQQAPANISDFANVLSDLRNVKNQAEIFLKLLEIAYKILQALQKDQEITIGETLANIVQFLWDYVKSNLRELKPGLLIEDPAAQIMLNKLMRLLLCRVEGKIDEWVEAFKLWLKTQFSQKINGPSLNNHMMLA